MSAVRVHNVAVSLDGYAAGPGQDLDHPLGVGGPRLHEWAFATSAFRRIHRMPDGVDGSGDEVDDAFVTAGEIGIGATVMGRKMFGPVRGPWGAGAWKGWWGQDPPFHHPVFVLTHHPRPSITMDGGTTFHFVTDGVHAALERALVAADGKDVRIGGGPDTIQQFLRAGLIDEMHLAFVPVLLGAGERLFDHLDGGAEYTCAEVVSSSSVTHIRLVRSAAGEAPDQPPGLPGRQAIDPSASGDRPVGAPVARR